jgi:inhibitor of KinA sporulation pathway (predicted exonuclease)
MSKKTDVILIVDIEATCWEGISPKDQESEIIEIGLCTMEVKTRKILENISIMVRPENSSISEFCTKLTSITQQDVDNGISFKEACELLKEQYQSKKRPWASYGAYDMNQFQKQCKSKGIEYPFSSVHINVKTLFSIKMKMDYEIGMAEALKMLNIPLEGTHHRGVDDAKNITKIFQKILD